MGSNSEGRSIDEENGETVFDCFVSGAKFGMVVAVLTLLVSYLTK